MKGESTTNLWKERCSQFKIQDEYSIDQMILSYQNCIVFLFTGSVILLSLVSLTKLPCLRHKVLLRNLRAFCSARIFFLSRYFP